MPEPAAVSRPLPPRLLLLLLCFGPAFFLCAWLSVTCLDFLRLDREQAGLFSPFATLVSLGVLLPPAFIAGLNRHAPTRTALLECGRACLLTFAGFVLLLFTLGAALRIWLPWLPPMVLPALLNLNAPLLLCGLLLASTRLSLLLLPPLPPAWSAPPAIRRFTLWAGLLIGFYLTRNLMTPSQSFPPPFLMAFLLTATVWLLRGHALRSLVPVWFGLCAWLLWTESLSLPPFTPSAALSASSGSVGSAGSVAPSMLDAAAPLGLALSHSLNSATLLFLLESLSALLSCFFLFSLPARRWLRA